MPQLREEITNWWKQANADLNSGKNMFRAGDYYFCVFACQQAAEKGLKAFALIKLKKIPFGHSLIYLAKELKVPKEIFKATQSLNPEYITTRYPDAANAAPVDVYNKEIASERLEEAERVLLWLRKQIER